ncbi:MULTISPECIES: ComEC/Rec2 family competence protein [Myroides]|uniref:ComEC/Rec2 family competence protein n=1 Tax=Myroides TaxID=76831 RepID=UPI0015FD101C|nr:MULTISPECIES: MBL fold metallo-hydrolase [Myroides]MBB1139035.1 MBL fold metallo-hydrolase [Myroides sp. WP-1]MDM1035941.1 MBL fold metallo-hydrolase [Myroides odoratimimus]MDM1060128.1 MBL fold metallo-hydrolase [Myroides odoratimimus]
MSRIHFLNVLEGDCNIIEHDSGRKTVIDVSNAYNDYDTEAEVAVKNSQRRKDMYERTQVPSNKKDYQQKKTPDNPIHYLKKLNINQIFRFIVTHPDMDHLDGIEDLFNEFSIANIWDTDNKKEISDKAGSGGYNMDDWEFYKSIRDGIKKPATRLTYFSGNSNLYYNEDYIEILSPTPQILKQCNQKENWNDSSYVILYTPPKLGGGKWKILFAGDSEDLTWEHIIENYSEKVANVDVLFAPHHGRDSGRNYNFLTVVNPKTTLFGNASSKHLAYNKYNSGLKITNNQAGYVVLNITPESLEIYVKNFEFARDFRHKKNWEGDPPFCKYNDAFFLCQYTAK